MICRRKWLESQRRHADAAQVDPCGECDACKGRSPAPRGGDRPRPKHMTCRHWWLVSKKRTPDVPPCGTCQECDARGTDPEPAPPDDEEGVVTSEEFPATEPEPAAEPTRDELIDTLEELGVKVDKRWGDKRLMDEYEAARAAALAG